jgi:hypothetical protein
VCTDTHDPLVAQLVEQRPFKPTVAGSNPAGGTYMHKKSCESMVFCLHIVSPTGFEESERYTRRAIASACRERRGRESEERFESVG